MGKSLVYRLLVIFMCIGMISCQENEVVPMSNLEIQVNLPYEFNDLKITNMKLVLRNSTTGDVLENSLEYDKGVALVIPEGVYSATISADIDYQTKEMNGKNEYKSSKIRGVEESFSIKGEGDLKVIDLFIVPDKSNFVLSEIFFTGSRTPNGSRYGSDTFFEIYNNSDKVLYADGLCISESLFSTTKEENYTPNNMEEYVAVRTIYTVPGNGKDYPILPGETLLIADVAKNHLKDNSNSFDLTIADFEWFDDTDKDTDIPSIPNMIKTYSYSKAAWNLHNRGYRSYVLFRIDKPVNEFLAENKYDCKYDFQSKNGPIKLSATGYKVNNSNIIDAVSCSTPSNFKWLVMSSSLDMSFTHSGDSDDSRYGRSVRRKVSYTETDGRDVLLDTNNSAFDFIPTAVPTPGFIE